MVGRGEGARGYSWAGSLGTKLAPGAGSEVNFSGLSLRLELEGQQEHKAGGLVCKWGQRGPARRWSARQEGSEVRVGSGAS